MLAVIAAKNSFCFPKDRCLSHYGWQMSLGHNEIKILSNVQTLWVKLFNSTRQSNDRSVSPYHGCHYLPRVKDLV